MSIDQELSLQLELEAGYRFRVSFDETAIAPLLTDEPPPLGQSSGPNPTRLLLAAVANCLGASLLFALRKFHNAPGAMRITARTKVERDGAGRWRVPRAEVTIRLAESASAHQQLSRILAQFEQFCVVTQSVRAGIAVRVEVRDADGVLLHEAGAEAGSGAGPVVATAP